MGTISNFIGKCGNASITFFVTWLLVSCGQSVEGFNPEKKIMGVSAHPSDDNPQGNDGSQNQGGFGSGNHLVDDTDNEQYPVMEYQAKGIVHSYGCISMAKTTRIEPSKEKVTIDITRSVPIKRSVYDDINAGVTNGTGLAVFGRPAKEELKKMEEENGFKKTEFLMFGKNVTVTSPQQSRTLQFSKPIPVLIVPAPKRRFKDLYENGPFIYSSQVSGDPKGTYEVRVIVKLENVQDKILTISVGVEVPRDCNGDLLKGFPLDTYAKYTIDTENELITGFDSLKNFNWAIYDSHVGKQDYVGYMDLDYKLCKKELAGKTENFPCHMPNPNEYLMNFCQINSVSMQAGMFCRMARGEIPY